MLVSQQTDKPTKIAIFYYTLHPLSKHLEKNLMMHNQEETITDLILINLLTEMLLFEFSFVRDKYFLPLPIFFYLDLLPE